MLFIHLKKKILVAPGLLALQKNEGPVGMRRGLGAQHHSSAPQVLHNPLGFCSEMHGIGEPWGAPNCRISDLTQGGFGLWSLSDALW